MWCVLRKGIVVFGGHAIEANKLGLFQHVQHSLRVVGHDAVDVVPEQVSYRVGQVHRPTIDLGEVRVAVVPLPDQSIERVGYDRIETIRDALALPDVGHVQSSPHYRHLFRVGVCAQVVANLAEKN